MSNKFIELEDWFEKQRKKREMLEEKYPTNIPNEVCKYAFLYGFSIENSFNPKYGDFNYLFSTDNEKIYIWTYQKNKNSALVSEVDTKIKEKPFWKTAAKLIQLSLYFTEAFESIRDSVDYKWMYHFNADDTTLDNVVFYGLTEIESHCMSYGLQLKATDIADLAPIIELLDRNDVAYNAVSLILSAFTSHPICLICELSKFPRHNHLVKEPEIWNQADLLQNLEISIVQSCRAVESIIGEPPNKKRESKVNKHKQKWIDTLGINPDDIFEKANKSYLDFYYELFFTLRNPSAHSYGNIHYDLERKRAVEAQCFSAIVLNAYIQKNLIDKDTAIKKLNFNIDLLGRVSENMSTCLTLD